MNKNFPIDRLCELLSENDSDAYISQNGDFYKPTWYRVTILGKNGEDQEALFKRISEAIRQVEGSIKNG